MAVKKETERSQQAFLNYARTMRIAVSVRLLNGDRVEGRISWFDIHHVLVEGESAQHRIAKSAIAMIVPGAPGKAEANRLGVLRDVRGLKTRTEDVRVTTVVVKKRRSAALLMSPADGSGGAHDSRDRFR
jgi:RNA chaperone Hfq